MSADELESLFRLYGRHVLRRANAMLGDGDAAKDVMQDVFARAFKARADLPNAAASVGWLYRITTNLCLSGMRDRNRRRQILDRWAPRPANTVVPETDAALTVRALLRDVPEELQELAIYRKQAADEGKPENIQQKIADGRLDKWYADVVLLRQPYFRDESKTVEEVRAALSAETGENIRRPTAASY